MPVELSGSEVFSFFHICNRILDDEDLADRRPSMVADSHLWEGILHFHDVVTSDGMGSFSVPSGKNRRALQRIVLRIAAQAPVQIPRIQSDESLDHIFSAVSKALHRRGYSISEYGEGRVLWAAFKAWEEMAISRNVDPEEINRSRANAKMWAKENGFYEE